MASSNNPFCPVRLAGAYAGAWGSEFVRIQDGGHMNIESGHGEWPMGVALLQSMAGDLDMASHLHSPVSSAYFSSPFAPPETV